MHLARCHDSFNNKRIRESSGHGSMMSLELYMYVAAAKVAVGMTSRLYVNEIRWRRPGVSMTVCQAGLTRVVEPTRTLSKSPELRILQCNAFVNHNHRCTWKLRA